MRASFPILSAFVSTVVFLCAPPIFAQPSTPPPAVDVSAVEAETAVDVPLVPAAPISAAPAVDVFAADSDKSAASVEPEAPRWFRLVVKPVGEYAALDADARTFSGREIADYRTVSGAGIYALEDELGRLRVVDGAAIASSTSIEPPDAETLRATRKRELLAEFGPGFETTETEHFLFVHNVSDGYIEWCARLFESLDDGYEKLAKKRGFPLKERTAPSVVVVFADAAGFDAYASRDAKLTSRLVAAYYNFETNRVVLYDQTGVEVARAADSDAADQIGEPTEKSTVDATDKPAPIATRPGKSKKTFREVKEILSRPNAAFNVATVVHEATHQIAFNRGLFLRTGPSALWAVEGLSLVFETPSGKASQDGWTYREPFPTNRRQLEYFRQFAQTTTERDPLRKIVGLDPNRDQMQDVRGFYAASWALFYYLYKKRPKELAAYLNDVAAKPPYVRYTAEERIADFEKHFGDDWEDLYKKLAKFVRTLK